MSPSSLFSTQLPIGKELLIFWIAAAYLHAVTGAQFSLDNVSAMEIAFGAAVLYCVSISIRFAIAYVYALILLGFLLVIPPFLWITKYRNSAFGFDRTMEDVNRWFRMAVFDEDKKANKHRSLIGYGIGSFLGGTPLMFVSMFSGIYLYTSGAFTHEVTVFFLTLAIAVLCGGALLDGLLND